MWVMLFVGVMCWLVSSMMVLDITGVGCVVWFVLGVVACVGWVGCGFVLF